MRGRLVNYTKKPYLTCLVFASMVVTTHAGDKPTPDIVAPSLPASPPTLHMEPAISPVTAWGSAEYLMWYLKSAPAPAPLVTTGPTTTLGPGQRPGTLGLAGTQTLIAGKDIEFEPSSGARFTAGMWLLPEQMLGIEGSYLFLAENTSTVSASAPGTPGSRALSFPFIDATTGQETSTGIAFPRATNAFSGSAVLNTTARLQGAELQAVLPRPWGSCSIEWLVGFRYMDLEESLAFETSSVNTPPLAPDIFATSDNFKTRNTFYGAQLGGRTSFGRGSFWLTTSAKVALGNVHEVTKINGSLLTNDYTNLGPTQNFLGGYLAQQSNIGQYNRDRFAAVPEVQVVMSVLLSEQARFFVGYNFLYISEVVRPGNQVDRVINPTQNPSFFGDPSSQIRGAVRPRFPNQTTDFNTQGLTFGLELAF